MSTYHRAKVKRNSCTRKWRYDSPDFAKMRILEARKIGLMLEPMCVYRCKFCKKHHIGHLPASGWIPKNVVRILE